MRPSLIRGLHNVTPPAQGSVACIGNFDGVHRGHQALLGRLLQRAQQNQRPAYVISFEPLPFEFFGASGQRLLSLREKWRLLLPVLRQASGNLLILRFNSHLASLDAEAFAQHILHDKLSLRHIVIGEDFRFARHRQGGVDTLQRCGARWGFAVEVVANCCSDDGQRISSTRLRRLLNEGHLRHARELLGRPFSLVGKVLHGAKRGRLLGFPTANIAVASHFPLHGVFLVGVEGPGIAACPAVVNIGNRPTFSGHRRWLEVHLLDFSGDLYGHFLHLSFLQQLRVEKRFANVAELQQQITEDITAARHLWKAAGDSGYPSPREQGLFSSPSEARAAPVREPY